MQFIAFLSLVEFGLHMPISAEQLSFVCNTRVELLASHLFCC